MARTSKIPMPLRITYAFVAIAALFLFSCFLEPPKKYSSDATTNHPSTDSTAVK